MPSYYQRTIRISEESAKFIEDEVAKTPRTSFNSMINNLLEAAIREKSRKRRKKSNGSELK